MDVFTSVKEFLEFAFSMELASESTYLDLAKGVSDKNLKESFENLAKMERGHQEAISRLIREKKYDTKEDWINSVSVPGDTFKLKIPPNVSYTETIQMLIEKEGAAMDLYNQMADASQDLELKKLMHKMALEEERHKIGFEKKLEEISS